MTDITFQPDYDEVLYENKWCLIVSKGTSYALHSKSAKYNDQYFVTLADAKKAIGIPSYI